MTQAKLIADTDPHRLARAISGYNLIGGALVEARSGRTFPVVNPATGREIGHAAHSDASDVDQAVAAAAGAQAAWAATAARKRGTLVAECARLLADHVEELGRLVALETGKALRTESRVEASVVADALQFYGGLGSELKGETVPFSPDMLSFTQREPIGVVGVIIPWNAPMMLMALKIAPALVAGNTVVVKSAEEAPLAVLRVCQILNQKLPPGVLNIVSGYGADCGAPLVAHPQVGKVSISRKLPGTLVVNVVENLPIAMVSTERGFLVFDERGRQLPLDPSRVPVDLPIAARRDTALFGFLARVRAQRPSVFARLSDVARVGEKEIVIHFDGLPVRAMLDVTPDRLAEIFPVEADLARRQARVAELDLRFRDQVIARLQ